MKKTISILLLITIFMTAFTLPIAALEPVNDLATDYSKVIANTFEWAKQGQDKIFHDAFLRNLGSEGDWLAFAVGRAGYAEDYQAGLTAIENYITDTYAEKGLLDSSKATEWHRLTLVILALGGDPTACGQKADGSVINLIADGVYNPLVGNLWKQGINGAIWGLIALDSRNYETPTGAAYDRERIINYILSKELSGGGFVLGTATTADPDITGMALYALAPYYHSRSDVKAAVDRALTVLSDQQRDDGDYASWGTINSESTAQVLIALCSLGIDPTTDSRFIKHGNTLLDGIYKYYNSADGGFRHSPSGASDPMATDQCRYALIAFSRLKAGQSSLFDFNRIDRIDKMTDVVKTAWYYEDVKWAMDQEIMMGISETLFGIGQTIKRCDYVTMLGRYEGYLDSSTRDPSPTKFSDVASTDYYARHVAWASDNKIIYGVSETTFAPANNITRQDMATLVARYADYVGIDLPNGGSAANFADDGQIADYAKSAVYSMKAAGIIDGKGNNMFDPAGTATREEAAKVIHYLLTL